MNNKSIQFLRTENNVAVKDSVNENKQVIIGQPIYDSKNNWLYVATQNNTVNNQKSKFNGEEKEFQTVHPNYDERCVTEENVTQLWQGSYNNTKQLNINASNLKSFASIVKDKTDQLTTDLSTEVSSRETQDNLLQEQIDSLEDDVDQLDNELQQETDSRKQADNNLDDKIDQQVELLSQRITQEAETRQEEDNSIKQSISEMDADCSSESGFLHSIVQQDGKITSCTFGNSLPSFRVGTLTATTATITTGSATTMTVSNSPSNDTDVVRKTDLKNSSASCSVATISYGWSDSGYGITISSDLYFTTV